MAPFRQLSGNGADNRRSGTYEESLDPFGRILMLRQASKFLLGPILALAAAGGVLLVDTTAAEAATTSTIKVSGKLKVRSAPNNSSTIVRQLKNKTKVTLDCRMTALLLFGALRTFSLDRKSTRLNSS